MNDIRSINAKNWKRIKEKSRDNYPLIRWNFRFDSCFCIGRRIGDCDLVSAEDFLKIWRRRKVLIDVDGCLAYVNTDESAGRRHYIKIFFNLKRKTTNIHLRDCKKPLTIECWTRKCDENDRISFLILTKSHLVKMDQIVSILYLIKELFRKLGLIN